jgi:hypothetical protein
MAKKKVSGNKTDRYINLILEISNTPGWQISETKLKELLGHPSKSQFYNYLQDLTGDSVDRQAILCRLNTEDGFFYKLNEKTWENFFLAKDEGEFLLECHKKLGFLIDNGLYDIELLEEQGANKNLSRKFIYLSAIQGRSFTDTEKENLHQIIKALMGDKKLALNYQGKPYLVLPLSLCQYRDELYLVAYKNKVQQDNYRVFKITRIKDANLLKEKFTYPAPSNWNPQELYKNTSGLVIEQKEEAIINVYGNAKKLIQEKNFFHNRLVNQTKEFDQYECRFSNIQEFLSQLFVYADEIQVVSPVKVQNAFHQKLNKALSLNQKIKKIA